MLLYIFYVYELPHVLVLEKKKQGKVTSIKLLQHTITMNSLYQAWEILGHSMFDVGTELGMMMRHYRTEKIKGHEKGHRLAGSTEKGDL